MSIRWINRPGTDPDGRVNAAADSEVVTITRMTPGRTVTLKRVDTSGNMVTVGVTPDLTLAGALGGTIALGVTGELQLLATDGGFDVIAGGGGGGGPADLCAAGAAAVLRGQRVPRRGAVARSAGACGHGKL